MNDIIYVGKHLRTYNVSNHSHESWELIYCTDGNGKLTFEKDSVLEYKKGDIVIIPPDIKHENNSLDGFTNIHLNIDSASLPLKSPIKISDDSEHHIKHAFADAFYYYNSQLEKKQLIISALGNLIINYVIAFQSNKPLSRMVEKIKADIVKNFPDCDYSLEKYIHSLPFSYDYLRKLFQSEMGITPHSFLTNMRMQTAARLLCSMHNKEYNISMIAQMCGYIEPLYFSRVFKNHFGCSPSDYIAKSTKRGT